MRSILSAVIVLAALGLFHADSRGFRLQAEGQAAPYRDASLPIEARAKALLVSFVLGPEQLRMLGADMKWIVEPGAFRVMIGSSAKDIRLRGELIVK